MSPQIAYLEISPRQTGKTTRLMKRANDLKAQGRTVIFVSPMPQVVRRQMPGVIVPADGESPPPEVDLLDAVWFYDEFDWLDRHSRWSLLRHDRQEGQNAGCGFWRR